MKIQYLNGGLANQVFQYIFVRYAELSDPAGDPWFFDDSFFFLNQVHNGFELEKVFGLKLNLLSRYFDADVWQTFLENKKNGVSVPQSFKELGFPISMITEFDNYREHNPFDGPVYPVPGNTFVPEITKMPGEFVYYHGYWLHPNWFKSYADIFKKELALPPVTDAKNADHAARIQSSYSVAVHIRRGDYVALGLASPPDYYRKKIEDILTRHPDAVFFVFSDDIPWCRENRDALGLISPREAVFIEGNTHGKNYIDIQLMSMCRTMLLGRSAFCYLAMLLNEHLEEVIFEERTNA